jgi:hypothetical protein
VPPGIFLVLVLECPRGLIPRSLVCLYAICRQKRWGINGAFTQRPDSEPPFIFCTQISHLLCYIPSNHIKVEDKPGGSYLHGYTFRLTIAFACPFSLSTLRLWSMPRPRPRKPPPRPRPAIAFIHWWNRDKV